MAKLLAISRLRGFSWRGKRWLWLGLGVALVLIAAAIYWLIVGGAWVEQPVMLRIVSGEVQIRTVDAEEFVPGADETWLDEGSRIRVHEDGLAVLQFFEGSAIKLEGPAEVQLSKCQSLGEQSEDAGRSIALDVLLGKVTVAAVRQVSPDSFFEVRTLNAVGMVEGTMFEVVVDEEEASTWEVGQGTVKVGAINVGEDLRAVVALIPLGAGDAVAVPPLPPEWREDAAILKRLRTATRNIVVKSVREGRSDVSARGTSLLASDPETGIAVFKVDAVVKLALTAETAREFPTEYQEMENQILLQMAPGVVVAKPPVVKRLFVPGLSAPKAWVTPTEALVRESPPDYSFSIYNVAQPLGVAVDLVDELIVVTESGGAHVTRVFDYEGNEIRVLVPPGTVPTERAPTYVAIDSRMGTIYVTDRMRHCIDMYDSNGAYLGTFNPNNDPDARWSPLGLAVDASGILYVTDVTDRQHRVLVFEPSGELVVEFGKEGKGEGEFSFPNDIAIHASGRIYVADSNNFRIQVFDVQGELVRVFSAAGFPRGMDIEGDYLYMVDTFSHAVRVYSLGEEVKPLFSFGEMGIGDGEFNFPNGLALGSSGRLYITDRENNRVQVWRY